jgi:hypothetical protein
LSEQTTRAKLSAESGDAEALRNGYDRPIGDADNGLHVALGQSVEYTMERPANIGSIRLVLDSDLTDERDGHMPSYYELGPEQGDGPRVTPIASLMTKSYRIEIRDASGEWSEHQTIRDNVQRLNRIPVDLEITGARFVPLETYGDKTSHIFAFDLL